MNLIYKKYQNQFINILSKSEPTFKDKGDILELYIVLREFQTCHDSEAILLYDDVPDDIKNKYTLTFKDTGIDVIKLDLNNNRIIQVIQCKNYSRRLSHHKLGTFYYWMIKLHSIDENIKYKLIISDKTRYNGQLTNLDVEVVKSSDMLEYLKNNFNTIDIVKNKIVEMLDFKVDLSVFKRCLDKLESIYTQENTKIIIDENTINDIDEVYFGDFENQTEFISINYRLLKILFITILSILLCWYCIIHYNIIAFICIILFIILIIYQK